ncbi:MAG TPA: transposase [Kofleriaceae bacterium]|nr:transposase [Kofleriaceae bacterium]
MAEIPRPMSKSPNDVARHALAAARDSLPAYSDKHSPKLYTQYQLFAISVLRQFFRTDLRGIVAILNDSSDLRRVLGLKRVPHYSTLSYAEQRLFRGGICAPAERGGSARTSKWATAKAQ